MLNNAQPAAHLLILRMFRLQLLSVLHINSLCGVPTVSRSLEAIIYATFLNLRFLDHYSSVLSVLSSGRKDFVKTVELFEKNPEIVDYLSNIVGAVVEVNTIKDMTKAFELDIQKAFGKTIMVWKK